MIYMSVGNWISVIGFSICIAYCLFLIICGCIKKHKAKKQIKKESEKKRGALKNDEPKKVE